MTVCEKTYYPLKVLAVLCGKAKYDDREESQKLNTEARGQNDSEMSTRKNVVLCDAQVPELDTIVGGGRQKQLVLIVRGRRVRRAAIQTKSMHCRETHTAKYSTTGKHMNESNSS